MQAAACNALVVMADGCESIETVTAINVLRRAGVRVTVASMQKTLAVNASRDIVLQADTHLDNIAAQVFDLIVLPGGEAGARVLATSVELATRLHEQRRAHRWTAAICAAPALVLAPLGLLDGKQATGYPAFREALLHYVDAPVVVDGHSITGQSPAAALAFALTCVEKLCGEAKRRELAEAMLVR
jgi:protein deglycase